jgi:hypothetical protein
MADVFISYAHEDIARVRELATALEASGFSVWWDRHIPVGGTFDDTIETALACATGVVVLWSTASVESQWVRNEATDANERGILLPALIQRGVRIPLAFRRVQAVDLTDWHGDLSDPAFADFVAALRRTATRTTTEAKPSGVEARRTTKRAISSRRLLTLIPWIVLSLAWAFIVRDGFVASRWLVIGALVSASALTILIDPTLNVWVVAVYGFLAWPLAVVCLVIFFNHRTMLSVVWRPATIEAAQDMVISVVAAAATALVLSRPPRVDQFDPRATFRGLP